MSLTAGALDKSSDIAAAANKTARLTTKQRLIAWNAALLLLAAAALKAWPLITGQAVETQAASLGKLILIQGEILLALWLVSEVASAWAFRTAIVFFAGAACVNLRSIWLGEVSCGCFGKVEVPPWVSLVVNAVAVAGLLLMRPGFVGGIVSNAMASAKSVGWVVPTCLLIVLTGVAVPMARFGMSSRVIDAPKSINLGLLQRGEKREVKLKIRNTSDKPLIISGAKTSCTCTGVLGLPTALPAGGSREIRFSIIPYQSENVTGRVILYCDSNLSPRVSIDYSGTLKPISAQ